MHITITIIIMLSMEQYFSIPILLTGLAIFLARIVDVSLGTLRTISIVQGRTWVSFWLGFVEIIIWLWVISTVIPQVREIPILAIFYAFGFACGNMVGIRIERWLAFGHIIIRVISREHSDRNDRCPAPGRIRGHHLSG